MRAGVLPSSIRTEATTVGVHPLVLVWGVGRETQTYSFDSL